MEKLLETVEILSDPEMMKSIHKGLKDIKGGRVKIPSYTGKRLMES